MKPMMLRYPVTLPDRSVLLPKGEMLTPETMDRLVRSAGSHRTASVRLFEHGTVYRDVRRFCSAPPYHRIFSDSRRVEALYSLMSQVELTSPLLGFLDYFKAHDLYTYRHILIVFALSTLLAQDLISDRQELIRKAVAAPTHDFGKICVPPALLQKATPLQDSERRLLEHHSAAGYVLLSRFLGDPESAAAVTARDHHERCDGSGYPRGIRLNNPIVEIVAVCDVFDALIADRPYRPVAYDVRTALEEITEMAATGRFNWGVVQALIAYNRKPQPPYLRCRVSMERRGIPPGDNRYSGVPTRPDDDSG
ncbi:MAG: HD-GYP domain-containing protein [Desulfobacterales bacterium]